MYSKVVARQLEEAKNVVLAVGKNADKVATALEQRFTAGNGDAAAGVDWKQALDELGRDLLETIGHLAEQDSEYQTQLLLEKQGRERRDAAMEKVRNQLRGARFLLDQTFGREKASAYFPDRSDLTRVLPRNLVALARLMTKVLRGAEVTWPSLEGADHVPQPQQLATGLEAAANELEALLEALAPERSASVFTRGTKRAELEASRKAVSSTTMALSGLFRVAGFDYAARRLRPPARRAKPEPEGEPATPPVPASSQS